MRWLSILVLVLALVAAGCGGGDDDSSASDTTAVEETTDATEETTDDDGSAATGDFDFADEDCQSLLGVGATIAAAFGAAGGAGAETDELQELAEEVPDEIQADVQTLADAFGEYAAKLEEIGLEAGATPTAEQLQEVQTAIASLDQEELTAASQRVQAWAEANCTG